MDRPIGSILQDIIANIQGIVRSEVRLAKTEFREEASGAVSALVRTAVGALLAAYAALFGLLAVVSGLALYVPVWLSAVIVSVVLGLAGIMIIKSGLRKFTGIDLIPHKTVQNVKEQLEWPKAAGK